MEKRESNSENSRDLGSVIKYYRNKKDLSLQELFEISGISGSYIQRLENGKRTNPSVKIIKRLSEVLEIPIMDLIGLPFFNDDTEGEKTKSIGQILINNNFKINEEKVSTEAREAVVDIIESIVDFTWNDEDRNEEIFELLNLVDDLKKKI